MFYLFIMLMLIAPSGLHLNFVPCATTIKIILILILIAVDGRPCCHFASWNVSTSHPGQKNIINILKQVSLL